MTNNITQTIAYKIGLFINYSFLEQANTNLEIIYVGERDDKSFSSFPAGRITLEAYTLVNFAAHYNLFEFLRIYVRVENLFDAQYEEIFGFGTPGLSVYGGLKLIIN